MGLQEGWSGSFMEEKIWALEGRDAVGRAQLLKSED